MDAGELAVIAYDAMPVGVLTPHDQGVVYGVLQMALRTLEAQHAALLDEADEETAEAKKLWREALAELEATKKERDAAKPYPVLEQTLLDMNRAQRERDAFAAELDAMGKRLADAQRDLNVVKDQCNALENERRLFLRGEGPPGALSLAQRDRENAVLEMKAAQRAADEFKLQRSVAESELSKCRADRDMFKRLRAQCMSERDAYATKLEEVQAELQKRINALNAENARLHRSLEERMTAHIPGAVQVAKTEELHGMAKVYLVPEGSEDL